ECSITRDGLGSKKVSNPNWNLQQAVRKSASFEKRVFSRTPKLSAKLWKYRPKRGWESTSGALPRSLLLAMTAIPNHLAPQSLEGLPWYAIQTRYRFERKAAAQLQNKGIETFLPVIDRGSAGAIARRVVLFRSSP